MSFFGNISKKIFHGSKSQKNNSKKNVHWRSADTPGPPGKPYLLPSSSSDDPDVVTIKWSPPASDSGSSVIGYIVEHKKTGSPYWIAACSQLVQYTELSVSGLEPGWRYQFRIIAENAVGRSEPSEPSDALTVTLQRTPVSVPVFVEELKDTFSVENEKIELRVKVNGHPAPQIAWFKDGFEIFSSRRTKIVSDNNSSLLIFYQASLTDEGEIKCTATNRAGYVTTKSNLVIEAPPKIRLPRQYEDGLIIDSDELVRLKVGIAGRPTPIVTWTHNGEDIQSTGRYEIENTDKNSTLKISNSNRTDRGEYILRAENKLGEDLTSFLVTVTDRPKPPEGIAIKLLLDRTVTLSWSPPEDDGGCKIGNYIVEYFRIGWDVWLKAATCRQLAITLNDLIAGSEYKFRVKAENPYGISEPSVESEILFIPDPSRGITRETLKIDKTQIEPKNLSPNPIRSASLLPTKKLSPLPEIKLNTKIFDDESINRDIAYGTSSNFMQSHAASSLRDRSPQQKVKTNKNNVKFNIDNDKENGNKSSSHDDGNFSNAPQMRNNQNDLQESKMTSKKTYLDLSKTCDNNVPSSVQNSTEFMLVLYDKESNNSTKDDSEFDLEDYCSPPPPLSLSAPELNVTMPEAPILRHASSSTELLYERAMARFYKAVEIEQHETARRRSMSVDVESRRRSFSVDQEPASMKGDLTLDSEKLGALKRRFSDDNNLKIKLPKQFDSIDDPEDDQSEETQLNTIQNEINTPDMIKNSSQPQYPMVGSKKNEETTEDYTASTVSSDDEDFEIMEKDEETSTRRSRYRSNEMETYHPRMLSPYRQPENSEAAAVLTKPLVPLPDPNFKPKPILKRPQSADGRRNQMKPDENLAVNLFGRRSVSPAPITQRQHRKSVEIDVIPKIMFAPEEVKEEIRVSPQPQIQPKIQPPPPLPPKEPEIVEEEDPEMIRRREIAKRRSEEQSKKMLEQRQNSQEESRVVADFYGDIIRDVSRPVGAKPKLPIYMDPEALKKLQMDDEDEKTENDSGITSSNDLSPPSSLSRPFSPTRGVLKPQNIAPRTFSPPPPPIPVMRAVIPEPPQIEDIDNIDKEKLINEIQTRGRVITPKSTLSGGKKRDQSHSRTRDSSVSRGGEIITTKNPTESTILRRREKSSSRTRNRSESKSPAAMNRKIIINKVAPPNVNFQLPPPPIQNLPRAETPKDESQEEVDHKVKSSISNVTDITILIFAAYLYFFKSAILALPILMLLIYRQISDKLSWFKRKKS